MSSRVIVENIWAEDLFQWFYEHIHSSGGDGMGAIVCVNFKEVSEWFDEYVSVKYKHSIGKYLEKTEKQEEVCWYDNNENWVFTNNPEFAFSSHPGDYIFVVRTPCTFGFRPTTEPRRTILPV